MAMKRKDYSQIVEILEIARQLAINGKSNEEEIDMALKQLENQQFHKEFLLYPSLKREV